MKKNYLNYLKCIKCEKEKLSIFPENVMDDEEFEEGIIRCEHCSAVYPILDGIPCFLPESLRDISINEKTTVLVSQFIPLEG